MLTPEQQPLRFLGVLVLATVRLGALVLGGLALVTVALLSCDDACSTVGDWSAHPGSWQWNALLALAVGIALAGMVSLLGVMRRNRATVAGAFVCELVFVAGAVGLLAWGERLDAAPGALALALVVEATGLTLLVLGRTRRA